MPRKIIAAHKVNESQSADAKPCPYILEIVGRMQSAGCDLKVIGEVHDLIDLSFAERNSKKT